KWSADAPYLLVLKCLHVGSSEAEARAVLPSMLGMVCRLNSSPAAQAVGATTTCVAARAVRDTLFRRLRAPVRVWRCPSQRNDHCTWREGCVTVVRIVLPERAFDQSVKALVASFAEPGDDSKSVVQNRM